MTVLDVHNPSFQLEKRRFEPGNSVLETCSNNDPDTGRLWGHRRGMFGWVRSAGLVVAW